MYDLTGRQVELLYDGNQIAGYHKINWNASGKATGLYFVKMMTPNHVETQKMLLIK